MKRAIPAVLATLLVLAACGGSGGGQAGPTPDPVAFLAITAANAPAATKASYQAALASTDAARLIGTTGLTSTSGDGPSKPGAGVELTSTLMKVLQKIPVGPETSMCAVTGSITISGTIENPLTLTEGDEFLIVAKNCNDGLGETIDGQMSFTVGEFDGDLLGGSYRLTMRIELTDFQVKTVDDVIMSRGDATVTLDTMTPLIVSASISGDALTVDSNARSETLSIYSTVQTLDTGDLPSSFTLVSSGTLDTTELDGAIRFSTPVMFEGVEGEYPSSGELLITGDNSSARLIAENNVDVRIEINLDSDPEPEETIVTTWAELIG